MIPKIIHYCWFGKNPMPNKLQKCLKSWKKELPEYIIMRWDESNFDVNSSLWTQQAYSAKKFAFVSDFVRLKVLYEYGGIYLDTDVMVIKPLDEFLIYPAFTGFESHDKLTSAVIGAEKGFHLIKKFLDSYEGRSFYDINGEINKTANVIMMTAVCQEYGLIPDNTYQVVADMYVFPKTYFCPLDFWRNKDFSEKTYTIHYFDASWLDDDTKERIIYERTIIYKMWSKVKKMLAEFYYTILKFK